jgi:translation initiation factor IF-2
MAQATTYRINRLAKDFNIKSKDILELLKDYGFENKTHMAVLEPEAFNLFIELLTGANQIKNIDGYVRGEMIIPRLVPKKTEPQPSHEKDAVAASQETQAKEPAKDITDGSVVERASTANLTPAAMKQSKKKDAKLSSRKETQPQSESQQQTQQQKQQSQQKQQQKQQGQKRSEDSKKSAAAASAQAASVELGRGQVKALKKNKGPWQPTTTATTKPEKAKKQEQPITIRQRTGGMRIVDTRSSFVDLSKYDEALNKYVSEREETVVVKQKLKKQNNRRISNKERDKERRALEKLRKEEIERERRRKLTIQIPDAISVGELASRLKISASEVIKKLVLNGIMASISDVIDFDTAYLITEELGVKAEREVVVTIEEKLFDEAEDTDENLVERSPVVCVMGHVDHGKTSLLDAIRHTNVTQREAGGITQHIGAYRVNVGGKSITFLDTPGHEAFTAMRARGAKVTDIAILVVAADDGIMPQTVEAINHAKAAGVDIIVAINKIDKPAANPDIIKQDLTKYDLVPEEWGGDVICVPVSALTGQGINDLLESILLLAEIKEYKANPSRRAKGVVIESMLDRGRGPVATILVQKGSLHTGDIVIAGTAVGRVRAMTDENGKVVKEAGPSTPVEIIGLSEVPLAGDEFNCVEDERMARELAEQRREKAREMQLKASSRLNLEDIFSQIESGVKNFNIIIKADVNGSAEAVKSSLQKLSNDEVKIHIIHSGVGAIVDSDVQLAAASNAIIIGFNVRPDKNARDTAERMGIEIRTYRIIYECIEDMQAAMKGMLAPKFREEILGHAIVRQEIHVPNVGIIAGSYVQDGKVVRNARIRIIRDGVVVAEDKISSLRHYKEDRREIAQGFECGIGLDKFNDIKVNDILECFNMVEIEQ